MLAKKEIRNAMTPRQKNRLTLAAIIGIFVLFIVAGRMVNVSDLPKTNKGHLIVPHVPIQRLQLKQDGAFFQNHQVAHWSLMYIAGNNCKKACKNALFYEMKRTRLSLGQDGLRLHFIVVKTSDNPALMQFVSEKLPQALVLKGRTEWVNAAMKTALQGKVAAERVYLVSPDGMIFMWYGSHADKKGTITVSSYIYADVKTTLKGSLTD